MATITTSIGNNSSITTGTPSSCSGSSSPYTVTFPSAPSGVSVGDAVSFTDEVSHFATYTYLITGISGSDLTLKYLTDDGGMGDDSPCSIMNSSYSQATGTFKRAYSTITAWEADLDNSNLYASSDDAVGEAYKDASFNEAFNINGGGTVGLSSVKLTVPTSQRHDGTEGTGVVNVFNGATQSTSQISRQNTTIEWFEYHMGSNTINNRAVTVNSTAYDSIIFSHNLIHDLTGSFPQAIRFDAGNSASDTRYCHNNIVYNIDDSDDRVKVLVFMGAYGLKVWNNTTYLIRTGRADKDAFSFWAQNSSSDMEVKNNLGVMTNSTGSEDFARYYASDSDYNASDFSTATGGSNDLTSVTTSQFVSVTAGAEDLHLATGASCIGAGVDLGTTAGVNIDIDGETRSGSWSIGADQATPSTVTVEPDAAALVITSVSPSVVKTTAPGSAELTITADNPTVTKGSITITPPAASLTITADNPGVIKGNESVVPTAATLVVTAADPTVVKGSVTITPPAASLLVTSDDPTVVKGSITITPATASVVITAANPTVNKGDASVTPSAGNIAISADDPTVVKGSVSITPPAADLVITASCIIPVPVNPEDAQVTITADTPSVVKGSVSITPPAASLTLGADNPTVIKGDESVTPGAASISITATNPSVVKGSVTITPAAAEIVITGLDPVTSWAVVPAIASISITADDPTLFRSSVTLTPPAAELAFSAIVGSVTTTGMVDFSTPLLTPPSITSASIKPPTIETPRLLPNQVTGQIDKG